MKIKTNKLIFLLTLIFLIMLTTSIASASEIDGINETLNLDNADIVDVNLETTDHFEGDELYVNQNVESSGDGSNDLPFKTIKEAIDLANTGKNPVTIRIHSGTYTETNMTITNSVVIKSYNGSVVLDGENKGWFFDSNNDSNYLAIHGLTFKNGVNYNYYDSTVGGVVKSAGHIDVVNCSFKNNFGGTGGGINSHNGANIINSTFENNKAEYNGAAAYVIYGQTNIVNCTFTNNTAKRQGGALRIQGDTYIEGSTFTGNYAGTGNFAGNGGAVRVTDGDLTIESSVFKNNSAKFEGGAVSTGDTSQYSQDHYSLNIYNSTFTENRARSGAAIIANDGINMTNSVLSNNSVSYSITAIYGQGSGIYVLHGNSQLVGNTIENNINQYNPEAADIYCFEGNVAENDNTWGSDSKIKTESGKTTNDVTQPPTISKPAITVQTGEKPTDDTPSATDNENPTNPNTGNTENENNNNEKPTNPDTEDTDNKNNPQNNPSQENGTENGNTYQSENIIDKIISQITNAIGSIKEQATSNTKNQGTSNGNQKTSSENQENIIKNTNNTIKTNTTKQDSSNADIGDSSKDLSSDSSESDGVAHEISALKSVVSNEYAVPGTIIIIIALLALAIGFLRKRKDDKI